jgi:hypothetical protein
MIRGQRARRTLPISTRDAAASCRGRARADEPAGRGGRPGADAETAPLDWRPDPGMGLLPTGNGPPQFRDGRGPGRPGRRAATKCAGGEREEKDSVGSRAGGGVAVIASGCVSPASRGPKIRRCAPGVNPIPSAFFRRSGRRAWRRPRPRPRARRPVRPRPQPALLRSPRPPHDRDRRRPKKTATRPATVVAATIRPEMAVGSPRARIRRPLAPGRGGA